MELAFLLSYIVLAALLGLESLAIHSVLTQSAGIAPIVRRRLLEPVFLERIPSFHGDLIGSNAIVDKDLEGISTALVFVDIVATADLSSFPIHSLLLRIHHERHVYVFLGSPGDDAIRHSVDLRAVTGRYRFRDMRFVADHDYDVAEKFGIDRFPVVVLARPDKIIERVWMNRTCRKPNHHASGLPNASVVPTVAKLSQERLSQERRR